MGSTPEIDKIKLTRWYATYRPQSPNSVEVTWTGTVRVETPFRIPLEVGPLLAGAPALFRAAGAIREHLVGAEQAERGDHCHVPEHLLRALLDAHRAADAGPNEASIWDKFDEAIGSLPPDESGPPEVDEPPAPESATDADVVILDGSSTAARKWAIGQAAKMIRELADLHVRKAEYPKAIALRNVERELSEPAKGADEAAEAMTPGEQATRRWYPDEADLERRIKAVVEEVTRRRAADAKSPLELAAPDLLAVCEDLASGIRYVREQERFGERGKWIGFGIDRLESSARAAIARAKPTPPATDGE